MKLLSGKYRPEWSDPCGGSDVVGIMELSDSEYRPKSDASGICGQLDGLMVLESDKYLPRIILDDEESCCSGVNCAYCFAAGQAPKKIKIIFSDIEACPGEQEPPNGHEFILTQTDTFPCRYLASETISGTTWDAFLDYGNTDYTTIVLRTGTPVTYALFDAGTEACAQTGVNRYNDCTGSMIGKNGTAVISWANN